MTLLSPPRVEDRNGSDARQDRQQTTAARQALAYRPALDGLRAVAIGMVILFHSGLSKAGGGFIGVDIFFVLSGYLVTSLVLVQRAAGTLRLVDFYGRRVRRLLPAALVVIAGVSLVWLVIASQVDRAPVAEDARWAALYLSNWHFADVSVDYFAAGGSPSPFLHFWSLSVEEQFYLAWPAIMVLVWRIRGGRNDRALGSLAVVAGVIAAASLAMLASAVASGQENLAHFGTHTRTYQLLFGALLAMLVQSHRWPDGLRRLGAALQWASIGVLFLLASTIVHVGPSARGLAAAVCTVGLLAALELHAAGAVGKALSIGPLVALGQISYATYLWHYPIIVTIRRFATVPPLHLAVATALLSTALAMLSLRVLEMPIRTSRGLSRRGTAVVVSGLACSLAVGLAAPALLHSERRPVVRSAQTEMAAGAATPRLDMTGFDLDAASSAPSSSPASGPRQADTSCTEVPLADCIVVQGTGRRVLLLGDSHAGMLVGPLRAIAESEDMTLALAAGPGCPWQLDLVFTRSDQASCEQMKQTWYDSVIPQFDPDVIVVVSRATDHAIGSDYPVSGTDAGLAGLDQSQLLAQTSERTLRRLATGDRRLVVIEPLPVSPAHALGCLSGARYADECDFAADVEPSAAERAYRGFATTIAGVRTIDMDPWVCPRLPTCEAVISDIVVRKDHDHLTDRFAATLSARLDLALRDADVL